jgi:ABC-type branched-subunit amino acid transport system substrate-binding protein
MTYHKILVGFIILFAATACHSGNRLMQNVFPSSQSQQPALIAPPPPSPKAAQDQVKLPPEVRTLTDTIFPPASSNINVALLLPLTGANAAIGKDLQDAAQLALFDLKDANINLLPFDTKGTPEGALAAMNKAVAARVNIVLGPLFSQEAAAISATAKAHSIPVVSFSNNTYLAQQDIFVFGFMPQQQITRVLDYAMQKGIHDYYVIAPDDVFGQSTLQTIELFKERGDFKLHLVGTYNSATNQGMVEAARNIAKSILAEKKRDSTPTQRALLIPEGGSKLLEISKLMAGFGLNANDVRLIGSGQWDDVSLGNYRRLYGGWFATASPTQRNVFEKHFEQTYKYKPVRIASIAYDAVALACFLSQQSGNHLSTTTIINERGFAGVDGAFRFAPNRIAERGLAVLEVIPNGFEIVNEAPKMLKNFSQQQ